MTSNEILIRDYLTNYGYTGQAQNNYVGGFDLGKPVYLNTLESGDIIYQFMRVPSDSNLCPTLGNWFCLLGASMNGLAIISGQGRVIAKVKVLFAMEVLEGTASPQATNWEWAGGGEGGATQIFIPHEFIFNRLQVLGLNNQINSYSEAWCD